MEITGVRVWVGACGLSQLPSFSSLSFFGGANLKIKVEIASM
jgi:hypothetical protein